MILLKHIRASWVVAAFATLSLVCIWVMAPKPYTFRTTFDHHGEKSDKQPQLDR